jgi:methylglutaconyl-CoA hydratase
MGLVETELDNGVMTITLCDEERRNALSRELLIDLVDAIDVVDNDPQIRVAVLTNRGSVFCAGANLAERTSASPGEARTVEISEVFQRIRHSPKPFVGRIAGHCVAGGVGLAAVLDISVAIESAMFGFTEVRVGEAHLGQAPDRDHRRSDADAQAAFLRGNRFGGAEPVASQEGRLRVGVAPAMISVVCLPKMRLADAQAAFLRGNRFGATEAARMGLINEVVSSEDLDREITSIINDLLAGEPKAIAASKQLTVQVPSMPIDEAFAWTTGVSMGLFSSDEAKEGMTAFLEKRPAAWVRRISAE